MAERSNEPRSVVRQASIESFLSHTRACTYKCVHATCIECIQTLSLYYHTPFTLYNACLSLSLSLRWKSKGILSADSIISWTSERHLVRPWLVSGCLSLTTRTPYLGPFDLWTGMLHHDFILSCGLDYQPITIKWFQISLGDGFPSTPTHFFMALISCS